MEGNYPPAFYCPERDQQENRQQQQQAQQHVAPYPMDLPYHPTSQHQPEFVVDQPLRAFPAPHPGASILRSVFHDSTPVLPNPQILQQTRQQSPSFHARGHGVKSTALPADFAQPITSHEPPTIESNTPNPQGETTPCAPAPKKTQSKEQRKHSSISARQQPSTSPPATNNSSSEPQLLSALHLKKNNAIISSSQELPKGLIFKVASEDKVEGVVAKNVMEKGVEFGPYTGTLMDEEQVWSKDTAWEICNPGGVFFYIDGRKNWMSHVRCAQSEEEQNMEAFQYYGNIYFRSTKVIEPGRELKVFYSEEYGKFVGIQTRLNDLRWTEDAQKFQCSQCEDLFTSAKLVLRHVRCEHTIGRQDETIPLLTWKKKKKKPVEVDVTVKVPVRKEKKASENLASEKKASENKASENKASEKKASEKEVVVFKCNTCGKVFPTSGRLKAHETFHGNMHTCPVCGEERANARALASHMAKHKPQAFECTKCNFKCATKTELKKHDRKSHGYVCKLCSKWFSKKAYLEKHERNHEAEARAESAAKEMESRLKTAASTAKIHEISEPAPDEPKDMLGKGTDYYLKQRPFKCRFCPKRYPLRKKVNEHEKEVHTREAAYKCMHCPMVFTSKARMMGHVQCHEQNRIYRCTLCPRSFASESALNNHQGEHTGLKPFKCEICGKGFRIKKAVYAHRRRMHQERPKRFFCSVCNKGFADKANLIKHERRHKGIRPYVCLECGKAFTGNCSLTAHKQALHTAKKAFSCEICGKTFSLNQHYTYHMFKHRAQGDSSLFTNASNESEPT